MIPPRPPPFRHLRVTLPPLFPRRLAKLLVGLFLFGIGMSLMVRANLGLAPWDVLAQGLARATGWSFGTVVVVVGAGVLLLWWPLRQMPGLGTVLNTLLIGPSAEIGLWLLPDVHVLWQQVLAFAAGLVLLALATGLYIGARFGAGPRDGLMTGLHRRLGWPIWLVRTLLEGSALVAGWLLGGAVGVGTVAFALLVGPLVGKALPWLDTPLPATAAVAST